MRAPGSCALDPRQRSTCPRREFAHRRDAPPALLICINLIGRTPVERAAQMTTSTSWPPAVGTPLSPAAVKVLLLGAGELGKEVVIALQRLGVEVIAADRYANAPGHQVAHRAHVLNMADPAALRALIEQERPAIVVPEIEAIATEALVGIERDGLARVVPTARAAQLTMNREGIRRLAAETLGLPTSPYRFASSFDEVVAAAEAVGLSLRPQARDVVVRQGTKQG